MVSENAISAVGAVAGLGDQDRRLEKLGKASLTGPEFERLMGGRPGADDFPDDPDILLRDLVGAAQAMREASNL
jgi:hypothetical protein